VISQIVPSATSGWSCRFYLRLIIYSNRSQICKLQFCCYLWNIYGNVQLWKSIHLAAQSTYKAKLNLWSATWTNLIILLNNFG